MHRMRDFRVLSPKWDISINPLPSDLSDLCGRGNEKTVGVRADGWHQGKCFLDTIGSLHIWAHRDGYSTHKTFTSSRQTKFQRGGRWRREWSPRSAEEMLAFDSCQKDQFPLTVRHLVQRPHSRTVPTPRRAGQHKLDSMVRDGSGES